MSLADVIGSFATPGSPYAVSRPAGGNYVDGRWTAGGPSAFTAAGVIHPADERELRVLSAGQRVDEVRVFYSTTELRINDRVTDGETWIVFKVEHWEAFGDEHWRAFMSRAGDTPV